MDTHQRLSCASAIELVSIEGGRYLVRPRPDRYGGGVTYVARWIPDGPPSGGHGGTSPPDEPQPGFQSYLDLGSFFA